MYKSTQYLAIRITYDIGSNTNLLLHLEKMLTKFKTKLFECERFVNVPQVFLISQRNKK